MLTSWDKSNPAVPLLAEGFARNVEAASKGNIKFVLSGPETVPGFEQLQPVAAGAFHMLFTHGIYHYGQTGLSVGLDAVRGTIEERRASGLFEALDKHYQKIGIKVVAVAISAKTGYAFALKTPVGADNDLKGKKVRGTPPIIRSSACSAGAGRAADRKSIPLEKASSTAPPARWSGCSGCAGTRSPSIWRSRASASPTSCS